MASKHEMTVSKTSYAFFTERHGSDGFHYHKVYNDERDIPEADYHGKTQVADLEVVASLKELLQRMKDGVYTARRLVLISCDKRFRDIVDDLRAKEMVVYFIKPECNVLQVEHNQSIYPKESTTTGIYIVAKTGEEKVQERKRVMNERIHLERQVGRMAIGEGYALIAPIFLNLLTTNLYIYIYIYVCVCVWQL